MYAILKITTLIFFSITFFGCSNPLEQQKNVKDVTQSETIILHKKAQQTNIHSISIKIFGFIEKQSHISLLLNAKEYKVETLKGKFSFTWGGEWYSDTAEIFYQPINVAKGKVTIRYTFKDI
jgi:hypothetical protein